MLGMVPGGGQKCQEHFWTASAGPKDENQGGFSQSNHAVVRWSRAPLLDGVQKSPAIVRGFDVRYGA